MAIKKSGLCMQMQIFKRHKNSKWEGKKLNYSILYIETNTAAHMSMKNYNDQGTHTHTMHQQKCYTDSFQTRYVRAKKGTNNVWHEKHGIVLIIVFLWHIFSLWTPLFFCGNMRFFPLSPSNCCIELQIIGMDDVGSTNGEKSIREIF